MDFVLKNAFLYKRFEGVMTKGFSSSETDGEVLANVVAAGYVHVK